MAGSPWRSERGQATLEWTALVAVVALVLAIGGAVAGGPGIVNAVGGALRQAICLVGGGDCRPPRPKACVLSAADASLRAGVKLSFLELGGHLGLLREARSDGTHRLTLVNDVEIGATAGSGARAEVELTGLLQARAGVMSEAEILARLGRRRSWNVGSDEEADELEGRIVRSVREWFIAGPVLEGAKRVGVEVAELPEPDESAFEGALEGSVGADFGALARAGLRGGIGATRGRDGTTQVTLTLGPEGSVDVQRAFFGLHAEGGGSAAVTVSFDHHGKATELEVTAVAHGRAQVALQAGGRGDAGEDGRGGRMEASATLDLGVSDHADVAERLLAALAPGRTAALPGAAAELVRRISSSGTLTAELRTSSREAARGELVAAAGAQAGVSGEASRTSSELVRAWWRPPGGVWDRRLDCAAHRA